MDPLEQGDPKSIGPFRLLRRLGKGGMGVVYLGESRGGHRVAIKVVKSQYATDPEYRARFRREVAAARQVGGFYTAAVVDADPDANLPWMATAYIEGKSLADAVDEQGPFSEARVRSLGAALAEGLAAIHNCGIIHRDLKPSNIIIEANDVPRIIDFGIAKSKNPDATTLTQPQVVIGTLRYISPEQLTGEEPTSQSDVFSLGAVLAYAATGHGPYHGSDIVQLVAQMSDYGHPDLNPLDGELREIITDCLAWQPDARPTPLVLLDRLKPLHAATESTAILTPQVIPAPDVIAAPQVLAPQHAAASESNAFAPPRSQAVPVPAPPVIPQRPAQPAPQPQVRAKPVTGPASAPLPASTPAPTPGGPRNRRRRLALWGAAVGVPVVVLAGVGVLLFNLFNKHPAVGPIAATWSLSTTLAAPAAGTAYSLAYGPGNTLAVGEGNGTTYLWNTATRAPVPLTQPGSPKGGYSVAYGPGGILAVGNNDGDTDLWSAAGLHLTTLADPSDQVVPAVAFGPGNILATDQVKSVDIWDTATRTHFTLTDPASSGIFSLAFGPDGTLAVGDHNGHTYVWSLATRQIIANLTDPASKGVSAVAFASNGTTLATGDNNGNTYLWDTATKTNTATLTDPASTGVNAVAFAPNGTTLAIGDNNGNTYLWDTATKTKTATLTDLASTGGVASVAFAPNGATLATGDSNGSVYLWTSN